MLTFLRSRCYILMALALTCLALYGLLTRQSYDSEWMLRANHVDSGQVQLVYIIFIGVLLLALPFVARIEAALQRGRVIVFILAAAASFLSISLLEPNQQNRLFITPVSIWIIIVHIVSLAGLAVWIVTDPLYTSESAWFKSWFMHRDRLLVCLYTGVIIMLVGLHILSVGEFMGLDTPDEPWLASMATNYAENTDLSPTFIGSSYGTPDPVLPRYYLLMGLWLRLAGSSLVALRLMPIFVLATVFIIMSALFWRIPNLTRLQRLGGIIVLLSLSALVRTSHNLRADVGLAVYGAVMVWALLQVFGDTTKRNRWSLIAGLALYIGLETIPFVALIVAAVAGIMLLGWLMSHRLLRREWQSIIIYGVCCALALGLYVVVRFLPDVQAQLSGYQRFSTVYSQQTGFGGLHFPLDTLFNYHLRFSLVLSPIELLVILGALFLCWRWGTSTERWLLLTFVFAWIVMQISASFTYGYWTLFVPLVAYAAARALRSRRVLLIGSFVLMPALVAAPINDMLTAIQIRPNQTYLTSLDQLTSHVPTGTTIVGESAFWFTLHSHRTFIGIDGFWIYSSGHQEQSASDEVKTLGVDALLCSKGNSACDPIVATGLFSSPETYNINNSNYLLYWRLNP